MFKGGKPSGRYIPGAPPPGSAPVTEEKKRKKTRSKNGQKSGMEDEVVELVKEVEKVEIVPEPPAEEDEATAKKIRNLTKKVCFPDGCFIWSLTPEKESH